MSDGSDVVEAMVEERMKISEEGIKERKVPKSGAVMRRVLRAALEAANPSEHDLPMIPIGTPSNRVEIVWNRLLAAAREPTDE